MSYILDALRKSEQERQKNQALNLNYQVLEDGPQQHSNKWLWVAVIFTMVGMLTLSVVWFLRSTPKQEVSKTEAQPKSKEIASVVYKQQAVSGAAEIKQHYSGQTLVNAHTDIATDTKSIALLEAPQQQVVPVVSGTAIAQAAKAEAHQSPARALLDKPATETNETHDSPAARLLHKPEPVKPQTQVKIAAPEPPAAQQPEIALEPAQSPSTVALEPSPPPIAMPETKETAPFLKEMPFEFRRHVPSLNINVFVYTDDPDERFVLINMRKIKPGQQIKDGMLLEQILPDSMLINYKNKSFRIKRP